jgi:magnesium chelatase family protein
VAGSVSVARVLSRAELGREAPLVQVEAQLGAGLPSFSIVGLPAPVVRESRERVRAAILSSGFQFPAGRITVNLAPAELLKHGGRFDLPIALALLLAGAQLRVAARWQFECYGELGLAGELKPVSGIFLAALHARSAGHALIVPQTNAEEARLSGHTRAYGVLDLRAASLRLAQPDSSCDIPGHERGAAGAVAGLEPAPVSAAGSAAHTLADVVGHWQAKRALTIAAAGGHSLLMIGPPGSGKSMLAARLPGLLPPLSASEALEVASVASMAGHKLDVRGWSVRPFRAPHHTASANAIVGGGPRIRPGEISLAHCGVLFLDELPEFDRRVLESLREPMETGLITIARAAARVELPAQFQFLAAMNPCPCGHLGDPAQSCRCSPSRIERYRQRISGPLLDRIDIRIEIPRLAAHEFTEAISAAAAQPGASEPAAQALRARSWRLQRSGCLSARLSASQLRACCALPRGAEQLLRRSAQCLALSGRGVHRVLALSRTIADLAGSETIEAAHLAEAVQLRRGLDMPRPSSG